MKLESCLRLISKQKYKNNTKTVFELWTKNLTAAWKKKETWREANSRPRFIR